MSRMGANWVFVARNPGQGWQPPDPARCLLAARGEQRGQRVQRDFADPPKRIFELSDTVPLANRHDQLIRFRCENPESASKIRLVILMR